jgi:methionine synthase II (cobalamin-independent)
VDDGANLGEMDRGGTAHRALDIGFEQHVDERAPLKRRLVKPAVEYIEDREQSSAFIGVINPQNPRVETPEEVCNDLVTAAKYIPKDQLGATDDCDFSPFSIDVKPKHGSPDIARDIAFQKITNRLKGAEMASRKLGLAAAA